MRLKPSVAVVSGASRGLGLAFVKQLLARTPAIIIATSRSGAMPAELLASGRVVPLVCDVTSAADAAALAERVDADHGGRVDMLLNVAGVLHDESTAYMPERSLASIDPARMQQVLAINAIGPVLVTQALARRLTKGAVVGNLSARVGSIADNGLGGWWSYRMSKAALNMATVNMAIELRRKGVIVAALHPGTTQTELSAPFQKNVKPEKLFTPEYSTGAMLDVLDSLSMEDTGGFYAYDGSRIEF